MSAALKLVPPAPHPAAANATLLHFLTCGSVDDGKSTLLGRMLFDSNSVLEDQLRALDKDSKRFGTDGENRDFALLVDGLSAEREQGITIDVAYRYFKTQRRSFIVADTPGHEQYTRNMATGASTAELAIILIDARKGVLPQTRRHSYIVSMLGVRHVVVAINKMDLAGFSEDTFRAIEADYRQAVESLGFASIVAIPLSAKAGDNVASNSIRTPWYKGPHLLEYLETVNTAPPSDASEGFRMPVQWVNRPNLDFRGYAGTIASGVVRVGEPVAALPSGRQSKVARIVTADGDLETAHAGQPVTITLADEIDVSRGDVLVPAIEAFAPRSRVRARVLWMEEGRLSKISNLIVKLASATANARMATLHNAVDIHSFETRPADALAMNEIGVVDLLFDKHLVVTEYATNRELGSFILIDRLSNKTVGLGIVEADPEAPKETSWHKLARRFAVRDRRAFATAVTGRIAGAAVLGGIVIGLSGRPQLAVAIAAAELVVAPALNRLVGTVSRVLASRPTGAAADSVWQGQNI